jgi:hypothetical protein
MGIVVFGREYVFGAGIQSEDPTAFRCNTGMLPVQLQPLGQTTMNRVQFEQWCIQVMQNGMHSAAAYDLLLRNCNNFSHDAALQGLRLSKGVPEWVLNVPGRFLSSTMGQMVRPMLQNMQVMSDAGVESIVGAAPFANEAPSVDVPSAPLTSSTSASSSNLWAIISTPRLQYLLQLLLLLSHPCVQVVHLHTV